MSLVHEAMLSRLAEHLYWMGRYTERAENTARLVSVHDLLLLDRGARGNSDWRPLVEITGCEAVFVDRFGSDAPFDERHVLRLLLLDPDHMGSMVSTIEAARENARVLRALLPREAWKSLNELALFVRKANMRTLKRRDDFLEAVVRSCQTLVGLLDGTMNHDAGYRFLELGRLLERADMTTRIIDAHSRTVLANDTPSTENNHWVPVLRSVAGYQMYRQSRQVGVRRREALDFLLRDGAFPRSCLFCVRALESAAAKLPEPGRTLRAVRDVEKRLRRARVGRLAGDAEEMSRFVDRVQVDLGKVHEAVAASWFLA